MRDQVDSTPMPVFAQNLIDEKNAEIDHLNEQLQALQQEVAENTMLQNANAEIARLVRTLIQKILFDLCFGDLILVFDWWRAFLK